MNPSSLSAAGRPDEAVSHSRWRHIGTYIVSFSNDLGPVSDELVCPFFVGRVLVEGPLLADSVEKLIYQAHVILQATAGVVVNPHET